MINKQFIFKVFKSAYMERWNDKIRPMPLFELDKQAHKMVIAYFIGKYEESDGCAVDWYKVIKYGIFEFLQRVILTDIKPPIFNKIKNDTRKYDKLNDYVYERLIPSIMSVGSGFHNEFRDYFKNSPDDINKRILDAAHFYSSKWEFDIIKNMNPHGHDIELIRNYFKVTFAEFVDLKGIKMLYRCNDDRDFIELSGQLRFQARWANLHRIPRTSVLGHSLFVAILSFMFGLDNGFSRRRCYNNFFTGLFHDMPEALTRDIISPIKAAVSGLDELIADIEKEEMARRVYKMLPDMMHDEMRFFTESPFKNTITEKGSRKEVDEIEDRYNSDIYDPRDGRLVRAIDDLGAYMEALEAMRNGCSAREFNEYTEDVLDRYKYSKIGPVDFGEIYDDMQHV